MDPCDPDVLPDLMAPDVVMAPDEPANVIVLALFPELPYTLMVPDDPLD